VLGGDTLKLIEPFATAAGQSIGDYVDRVCAPTSSSSGRRRRRGRPAAGKTGAGGRGDDARGLSREYTEMDQQQSKPQKAGHETDDRSGRERAGRRKIRWAWEFWSEHPEAILLLFFVAILVTPVFDFYEQSPQRSGASVSRSGCFAAS
jgi:hypothetical protein